MVLGGSIALDQTRVIPVTCDQFSGSQDPIFFKSLSRSLDVTYAMSPTIPPYSPPQLLTDRAAVSGPIPTNSTLARNNNCDRTCTIVVPTIILSIVLLSVLFCGFSYWRSRGRELKKSTDQAVPRLPRFPKLHCQGIFSGCVSRGGKDRQGAVVAGNEMKDVVGARRLGSLRKGPRQSGYVDIEEGAATVRESRTMVDNDSQFEAARADSGLGDVPIIPSKYPPI